MGQTKSKKRVAILISGRGSNMETLVRAAQDDDYPAQIVCVISDKSEAGGLETARSLGVPAIAVPRKDYATKLDHEAAVMSLLRERRADLICLAGYMRVLSSQFVQAFEGRIINIHPSLLPKYKGLDTHNRALLANDTQHGCSVHFVTAGLDEGPVILQATVPVLDGDTEDSLAARVLVEEHRIYPLALGMVATGEATLS